MTCCEIVLCHLSSSPSCVPSDPSTTTSSSPETTTRQPGDGSCGPNEVIFAPHPDPSACDFYTLCACGRGPGLHYDHSIKGCNFIQLVDCVGQLNMTRNVEK